MACTPYADIGSLHPDEVLYERGLSAVEQNRFDNAHLVFETLINTYPDSPYADRARTAMQDPRIANYCDGLDLGYVLGCESPSEPVLTN